ncbi:MAG: DUF1273 family protein [Oscillospiraceae bacterium]|nr:DUF1273 family protein [Oscillospiraceae bacterium]
MSERSTTAVSPLLLDRQTTACFSGHRPEKIPFNIYHQINKETYLSYIYFHIHQAYEQGYRTFLTGMARGFDILAATAVIKYRRRFSVNDKINLVGVSPFLNEIKHLHGKDLFNYNFVKSNCDEMIYLNQEYTKGCFHQRNRFMVDRSSLLICSCIDEKSGTGSTMKYALKKGLTVDNINISDFCDMSDTDYPLPKCGYWIMDTGAKGTVTRVKAAHPFLPVNDTSDKEKMQ